MWGGFNMKVETLLIKIISYILIKFKIYELKIDKFGGFGENNSKFVYYKNSKWFLEEDLI